MFVEMNEHTHKLKSKCSGHKKACSKCLEPSKPGRFTPFRFQLDKKRPQKHSTGSQGSRRQNGKKRALQRNKLQARAADEKLDIGREASHSELFLDGQDVKGTGSQESLGFGEYSSLVLEPPPPWMLDVYKDFVGESKAESMAQQAWAVKSGSDWHEEADLEADLEAVMLKTEQQCRPMSLSRRRSDTSDISDVSHSDLSANLVCRCATDLAQCLDHLASKDAAMANTMSLLRRLELGAMACRRASQCTACTACSDHDMLVARLVQQLSKIAVELAHKALANTLDDDSRSIVVCSGRCGVEQSKLKVILIYNGIRSDLLYLQDSLRLLEQRLAPASVAWTLIHAELMKLAIATSPLQIKGA
ncbi:hypothetical protein CDD81_2097 [Ophiocordyceps australis]|uniref:Uncharacterized protein n=1 Tax=Ophiocordyceps australis TaxID=1399860 RepID=A0A2C5X7S4_9HYPO|nr:hypothetical protein CDD81_2097 [Ophiocordyceps australis]